MIAKTDAHSGNVVLELKNVRDTALLAESANTLIHIRRILVPVDFSACSRRAVQYALAFAKQFRSEIEVVHVVELDFAAVDLTPLDITAVERQVMENVTKRLKKFVAELDPESTAITTRVVAGNVKKEILAEAATFAPDLIIVGTHGTTGLRHALLGSVAEGIVRHASCPALTVREVEREMIST